MTIVFVCGCGLKTLQNVCGLEGKSSVSRNLGQIRFKKNIKSRYDVISYTAERHMLILFPHTAKKKKKKCNSNRKCMRHPTVKVFGYQPSVDSQMTSAPHTQASITRWPFNFRTIFLNQEQELNPIKTKKRQSASQDSTSNVKMFAGFCVCRCLPHAQNMMRTIWQKRKQFFVYSCWPTQKRSTTKNNILQELGEGCVKHSIARYIWSPQCVYLLSFCNIHSCGLYDD